MHVAQALLIGPMRRHAVLGHLMHPLGANLHLDGLPLQTDDGGVQGLVAVVFGHRHVVFKAPRDRRPDGVDNP